MRNSRGRLIGLRHIQSDKYGLFSNNCLNTPSDCCSERSSTFHPYLNFLHAVILKLYFQKTRVSTKLAIKNVCPCLTDVFASIFRQLKLELLTQFPASNDEKYVYL